MARPRRRLRRKTWRARRRWHRTVRPLRWPIRVIAVLVVAVLGVYAVAVRPSAEGVTIPLEAGPGGTTVVGDVVRGDAVRSGLRPGDRVLSVVERDTFEVAADQEFSAWLETGDTLRVRFERDDLEGEIVVVGGEQDRADAARFGLSDRAVEALGRGLLLTALLAFLVSGLVLIARTRGRGYPAQLGVALLAVPGLFGFSAIQQIDLVSVIGPFAVAVVVVALVVAASAIPAVASALVRFPNGRYIPRWTRWTGRIVGLGFAGIVVLLVVSFEVGTSERVRSMAAGLLSVAVLTVPVVGLVQKYRRSTDAAVRQRMKWVVLPVGVFVLALSVPVLGEAVAALDSSRRATGYLFDLAMNVLLNGALAAVPLGVLAGTFNFRPWDADLWIARSAAVGAATLGLAAVFAGGAEALRVGLRSSMGDGAESVAAALAAVVALAVFNPMREWLTKRADADLVRTRERLTERLPLLLAGRQVVASPEEVGRVAIAAVRDALETDRAAVLDLDPDGWEVVAVDGLEAAAVLDWANATLDASSMPPCSVQVWEDPTFVLWVPLWSVEDELVGVLALGTHGRGRGYSTDERRSLDAASRSLAEALRVAERREESEARQYARLAALVDRLGPAGDGAAPPAGSGQALGVEA